MTIHPFPDRRPAPNAQFYALLSDALAQQRRALHTRQAALEFAEAVGEYALREGDAYLAEMTERFRQGMERLK